MRTALLFTACLALASSASAQAPTLAAQPTSLNRKTASALIVSQTKPEYPPIAKINYIQGRVRLQLLVSAEGKVAEANVVFGHPLLAAAALKAAKRWLYTPFKARDAAVSFVTLVDVKFDLRNLNQDQGPPETEEFLRRQVRPPLLIGPPESGASARRLRVLVDEDGHPLDVNPIEGFPLQYETVLELVRQYKFQPAHWGPLPVPWYLDIDVPARDHPLSQQALLGR